jgi:hypothetical protein
MLESRTCRRHSCPTVKQFVAFLKQTSFLVSRYDRNKDGYLDKEEYRCYLQGIGVFWHNDYCGPDSWDRAFVRPVFAYTRTRCLVSHEFNWVDGCSA